MTDSVDDLDAIGKALAAAAKGEPVELTEEQREVLAHATVPDTLDAILVHAPILPRHDGMRPIAKAWSDELRTAFRLQSTTDKITKDDSLRTIQSVISQDDRLSTEEKQVLLSALPGPSNVQPVAESPSSQIATKSQPRVYLASISVEGFRGIGSRRATLSLESQAGLTLIYGVNGSGKSTFVEALDILLTGSTARFAGRGREWRSAWANAHSPDRGRLDAEFVVEDRDTQRDTLTCDWTATNLLATADEKDTFLRESIRKIADLPVADALEEFRPILGYGELGPLFDEGDPLDNRKSGNVTLFAQHIRARANIRDGTTDALWELIRNRARSDTFYEVLSAWAWIIDDAFPYAPVSRLHAPVGRLHAPDHEKALRSVIGGSFQSPQSPSDWNWRALVPVIRHPGMREVARAYLPCFSDSLHAFIVKSVRDFLIIEDRRRQRATPSPLHEPPNRREEALLSHSKMHPGDHAVDDKMEEFLEYTPRVSSYAEMLLDEIHSVRLEQFSQRVSNFWQRFGATVACDSRRYRYSNTAKSMRTAARHQSSAYHSV